MDSGYKTIKTWRLRIEINPVDQALGQVRFLPVDCVTEIGLNRKDERMADSN